MKLHQHLFGNGKPLRCNAWAKPRRCAYIYIYHICIIHMSLFFLVKTPQNCWNQATAHVCHGKVNGMDCRDVAFIRPVPGLDKRRNQWSNIAWKVPTETGNTNFLDKLYRKAFCKWSFNHLITNIICIVHTLHYITWHDITLICIYIYITLNYVYVYININIYIYVCICIYI